MRLPHDETGDGPAVVLLHAGVADRTMWEDESAILVAAGYRAVAVDLPGYGDAPVPAPDAPWRDVLETMDALHLDRATVVGNSFGGMVALRIAVVAPERVGALVLVSALAPGVPPSPDLEAAWAPERAALDDGDLDGAVRAVVDAWTLPGAPAALRERLGAMQRRALETQMAAGDVEEAPDPLDDPDTQLPRLTMPALVLAGEFDRVDFRTSAELLAAQLGDARHAVVMGAGHLAPLEQPAAFRALVLEFLRAVTAPTPRAG